MRKEIPNADALVEMIVRNIHHHGICRHFKGAVSPERRSVTYHTLDTCPGFFSPQFLESQLQGEQNISSALPPDGTGN